MWPTRLTGDPSDVGLVLALLPRAPCDQARLELLAPAAPLDPRLPVRTA